MKFEEFGDLLEAIAQLEPVASTAVDGLQKLGPAATKLFSGIVDGICGLTVRAVNNYEQAGFTRDQAIMLHMNDKVSLRVLAEKQHGAK